jgi:GT2 family glycosyltransferase
MALVIPTYRRPEDLRRCLQGVAQQTQAPDEVVVVVRGADSGSRDVIDSMLGAVAGLRPVLVVEPGVLAAMREGVAATIADLIAFTDDDTVPPDDWIARLRAAFSEPTVGLVGGRDVVDGEDFADRELVGKLHRWGKLTGNHHRGCGERRSVDVLKGANMAARRAALALPMNLRGGGAQVHWEVATSLWASAHGWRLVYDPDITLAHFPGPRHDQDARDGRSAAAVFDEAYNLQFILASLRPRLGLRALFLGLLVGTTVNPGLLRGLVAVGRAERDVLARIRPSMGGRVAGYRAARRKPGLSMWVP